MDDYNNFYGEYRGSMDEGSFHLPFGLQSSPTSPMIPNQLEELGKRLNEGVKNVEIGAISQDVFETIPVGHFKEIGRLAKLTDSKVSVHAPIVDPAGFTQEGWKESNREQTEEYLKSIVDRTQSINPDGNTVINLHTTGGVPAYEWKKGLPGEKNMMFVVNQETGQLAPLKYEKLNYLGEVKDWTPDQKLEQLNESTWENEKLKLISYDKAKDESERMIMREKSNPAYQSALYAQRQGHSLTSEQIDYIKSVGRRLDSYKQQIESYDKVIIEGLQKMNHNYKEFHSIDTTEQSSVVSANEKALSTLGKKFRIQEDITEEAKRRENEAFSQLSIDSSDSERLRISGEINQWKNNEINSKVGEKLDSSYLLSKLNKLPAPELFRPVDDFTKEKTVETLANVAAHAYEKYGENAPILSTENWEPGSALSRADSMKELIVESRDKLSEKLIESKNLSKTEADRVAEKLIGATWDIGHIYQLKKHGYSKEDIIEETEKISPYLKHVHLTDNFGYTDSHLAPGMGDVPVKEMIEKMRAGSNADMTFVNEAGGFVKNFKQSPLPHTLEALDSPIYAMDKGPNWSQVKDFYASYTLGYNDLLTDQQYTGGFSGLPLELGARQRKNE
jgi:hypothetical protein